MEQLKIPKKEQIDGILFKNPYQWAVEILRSLGWTDDRLQQEDPFRYIGFDHFITSSEEELYSAALEYGFDQFCAHCMSSGTGVSLYKTDNGEYVHSHTERGIEHIYGSYSTIEEAHRSIIRRKLSNARSLFNSRKTWA